MREEILKALGWRYAVQTFDPAKSVSEEDLNAILESGRLAPSAFGVESWKFFVVTNKDVRAKLREASYGQSKVTDAPYLIVIASRTNAHRMAPERIARTAATFGVDPSALDGFKQMIEGGVASRDAAANLAWMKAQAYIPLGMMIETAALLGVDAGPMEGFDPSRVNEILGLDAQNLTAATMLALGYRGDDAAAARPKVRRAFDEVVQFVS